MQNSIGTAYPDWCNARCYPRSLPFVLTYDESYM